MKNDYNFKLINYTLKTIKSNSNNLSKSHLFEYTQNDGNDLEKTREVLPVITSYDLLSNYDSILRLNEKGFKAEKLGFEKYLKTLNVTKMTQYQQIYLIGFFIFGFSSLYLGFQNNHLKSDYKSLKTQYDVYRDSVAELKKRIELYKVKSVNDTLQAKYLNDSKMD